MELTPEERQRIYLEEKARLEIRLQLEAQTPRPSAPAVSMRSRPSNGVAAVLSLVIPGAGQMYMGCVGNGILWLVFTILGYSLYIVPGIILHLICIIYAGTMEPAEVEGGVPPSVAAKARSTRMFCPSCGKETPVDSRYCTVCGKAIAVAAPSQPDALQHEVRSQESNEPRVTSSPTGIIRRGLSAAGTGLLVFLITGLVVIIIAAIAIPKMDAKRMRDQEKAAIEQIKTIQAGQSMYYSQFGRFATKLEELGPPASGAAGPAAADFLPGDLAKGVKNGYQFILVGGPNGYTINANPQTFGSTGRRTFFSDQSHIIRQNWTAEPATANSDEIK